MTPTFTFILGGAGVGIGCTLGGVAVLSENVGLTVAGASLSLWAGGVIALVGAVTIAYTALEWSYQDKLDCLAEDMATYFDEKLKWNIINDVRGIYENILFQVEKNNKFV